MDAVDFLKAYNRMCDKYGRQNCCGCPLKEECCDFTSEYCNPEKIVFIVEQWAKEHPVKTRQDEFIKRYPNAAIDETGICKICPCYMLPNKYDMEKCNCKCRECRHDYWMEEV